MDPGQNGHTPKWPLPKRPQNFWLPKRPQPKWPHCIGQNGHIGWVTTKTAKLHLVKTATKGGSLPKRPHCIWSKRLHREGGSLDRITSKTATLAKWLQHESLPKRPHYRSLARQQSRTQVCLLACSRAHFFNDFSILIKIRWKLCMLQFLPSYHIAVQRFAHATTAQLYKSK